VRLASQPCVCRSFLIAVQCRSGIGKHIEYKTDVSQAELMSHRKVKNSRLICSQKEDTRFSKHLMQACRDDAVLGRMDPPQLAGPHQMDLSSATFSPRFGVEQGMIVCSVRVVVFIPPCFVLLSGVKADGSRKVRPIDDMTRWPLDTAVTPRACARNVCLRVRSGCNAATAPGEKLEYETLDLLQQAMRTTAQALSDNDSGVGLSLWKADIDSAFRRIPIKPAHRSFAWICFKYNDQVVAARHLALMFGSVASVHHWERVGAPSNVRECGTSVCVCECLCCRRTHYSHSQARVVLARATLRG